MVVSLNHVLPTLVLNAKCAVRHIASLGEWYQRHLLQSQRAPPLTGKLQQCDFRFDLFFSFSFVVVLQYFFILVLVLPVIRISNLLTKTC